MFCVLNVLSLLNSLIATSESLSILQLISNQFAPRNAESATAASTSNEAVPLSEHDRISIAIFQHALILGGFVPIIISLAHPNISTRFPSSMNALVASNSAQTVRIEASKCILEMCRSDETSLKLFVSCGGVQYLIDGLADGTSHSVALVIEIATVIVQPSLSLEGPINVLSRSEFIIHLTNTLVNLTKSLSLPFQSSSSPPSPQSRSSHSSERSQSAGLKTDANEPILLILIGKISHILSIFVEGDVYVKSQLLRLPVLSNLLSSINQLHSFAIETEGFFEMCRLSLVTLLKVLAEFISFHDFSASTTLNRLRTPELAASESEESRNIIGSQELASGARHEAEIISVLSTIVCSRLLEAQQLSLCILHKFCGNKSRFRLEQTALAPGLIFQLQALAIHPQPSVFRQFAFDLLISFPKASSRLRFELKKYGGPQFYLDLREPAWGPSIFEVICDWLAEDTKRVELVVRTPTNLNRLFMILRDTSNPSAYVKLLPLFSRLIASSASIGSAFTQSKALPAEIASRFQRHATNNIIRSSLLTILKQICQLSTNPMDLIMRQFKVYQTNGSIPSESTSLFSMLCELKKDSNNPYVGAQALQVLIACDRAAPLKRSNTSPAAPSVLKPAPPPFKIPSSGSPPTTQTATAKKVPAAAAPGLPSSAKS